MKIFYLLFYLVILPSSGNAMESTVSVLLSSEQRAISSNKLNPVNRVAKLPSQFLQVEGRIDANHSFSFIDLVVKPRAEAGLYRINGNFENSAALFLQEGFLRANLTDSLAASFGRIQFGWGPAESISPSNWFVPEVQWQASPYFEQLGVYRGQVNFSPGQDFSFILMQEIQPLNDRFDSRDSIAAETFRKRTLAKAEWSWNSGNQILGIVGGRDRRPAGELWRAGGYVSLTANDAWQFYADSALKEQARGGSWKDLSVGGVRYTFENGAELRLEEIHQGSGLRRGERQSQEASLSILADAALRELVPEASLSLPGRNYAYAAFRWSNPPFFSGVFQTPILFFRALHSWSDHSSSLLGGIEVGFWGYFSTSLYASAAAGPSGGELRKLYDRMVGVAGKVVF